jgi:hypothetical protein
MFRHQAIESTFLTFNFYLVVKIILVPLTLFNSLQFPSFFQFLSCCQAGLLGVCKATVVDSFKLSAVLPLTHLLLKGLPRRLLHHLLLSKLHLIVNISSRLFLHDSFSIPLFIPLNLLLDTSLSLEFIRRNAPLLLVASDLIHLLNSFRLLL